MTVWGSRAFRLVVALTVTVWLGAAPVSADVTRASVQFTRFASASAFTGGSSSGTQLDGERLALAPGEVSGTWLSPVVHADFGFTRLVASWNADTPADSRIRIETQTTTAAGETSDWYTLGIWAAEDRAVQRTSVSG